MKIKCNDIIESLSVHDFKYCKYGACSIDSGNEYTKISGDSEYISWVCQDGREEKINIKNRDYRSL